jgi:hypothetical protein
MNKKHAQEGHEGLAGRRAELIDELARLEMRQAALSELLAMVEKQEAVAAEVLRLARRSGEIN